MNIFKIDGWIKRAGIEYERLCYVNPDRIDFIEFIKEEKRAILHLGDNEIIISEDDARYIGSISKKMNAH